MTIKDLISKFTCGYIILGPLSFEQFIVARGVGGLRLVDLVETEITTSAGPVGFKPCEISNESVGMGEGSQLRRFCMFEVSMPAISIESWLKFEDKAVGSLGIVHFSAGSALYVEVK